MVAVEDPEEGTVPVPAEVLPGCGRGTSRCCVSPVGCMDTVVLVLDVFSLLKQLP